MVFVTFTMQTYPDIGVNFNISIEKQQNKLKDFLVEL